MAVTTAVWAVPRSLATTCGITLVFFSWGYLDVSVPPVGHGLHLQYSELSHSEICGSQEMCSSPQLFAAYHVLLSLWEPRHPLYALNDFLDVSRVRNRIVLTQFLHNKNFNPKIDLI